MGIREKAIRTIMYSKERWGTGGRDREGWEKRERERVRGRE
jgi:hypothetical protein